MELVILYSAIETVGPFLILFSSAYLKIIQQRLAHMRKSVGINLKVADSLNYDEIRGCVIFHQKVLE